MNWAEFLPADCEAMRELLVGSINIVLNIFDFYLNDGLLQQYLLDLQY